MIPSDPPTMQSYPDPTDNGNANGGPFYSPQNNGQQRLTNPDELQLAAQLSRGLEPMMGSASGGLNEAPDLPSQSHANHQYAPDQHLRHQLEHVAMNESQYPMEDGDVPPRKRTKVSRACDECRRKKIRCDATSEAGDEQCSNCKRVNATCQFSRVPMKRGPSKGYIKELADRLNTLEGAMQAGEIPQFAMHQDGTPRRPSNDFTPPPPGSDATHMRKRAYSTMSNDFGTPYQPQRPTTGWQSADSSRQASHPNAGLPGAAQMSPDQNQSAYRSQYSPNGMAPQPTWKNGPDAGRRSSVSIDAVAISDQVYPEHKLEWDDALIEGYYKHIHPTFPMLPYSQTRLGSRLGGCPATLREAFMEALYATVRSFSTSNTPPHQEFLSTRRAVNLITTYQYESPATRTLSTNLIHLQILVLLAIEAENHGPGGTRGQTGPFPSLWLGSAVGLAYSMKLHDHKLGDAISDADRDSDEMMARRTWLSLVILDRYHAASTSSPVMIPETSVVLRPEDKQMIGEDAYTFERLSSILGHVAAVIISPADVTSPKSAAAPLVGMLLTGELERFRETFPLNITPESSPLVHLAFHYVRLLIKRTIPASDATELLTPAIQIVSLIGNNPTLTSPLLHHYSALAALTLVDLLDVEITRNEAEVGIKMILDSFGPLSAWDVSIRDAIQKKRQGNGAAVPAASAASQHALTASQGLQHLADLATATEADRTEALSEARPDTGNGAASATEIRSQTGWDSIALTKDGYLSALAAPETGRS